MEITIPTSLSEINCFQLSKINEAVKLIDNDTLLKMTIVSIVTNITLDKVAKISMTDINEISDSILNLLQQKPETEIFKINGVEFGFIPNLEEMKGNEYLDLEMHLESDIFKAMAVMYRPIKRKAKDLYTIEKYKRSDKYSELMKDAPASAYISARFFFLNLLTELLNVTPAYLLKNLTNSEVALLEKNGVGISQLMNSLQGIDSDLKRLYQN
jgi:hypothetical protein